MRAYQLVTELNQLHKIQNTKHSNRETNQTAGTIESIGSSTRIEGSKLSDREVERLMSNLESDSFTSRDE